MQKPAWQRAEAEAPLARDLPIIDPHHHFWEEGEAAKWFGRLSPSDLVAEIEKCGHAIVGSVFVDCGWGYRTSGPESLRVVGETEQVDAQARRFEAEGGRFKGIA